MKAIITGLLSLTLSLSLFSQGIVRIEVMGNKNKQIVVDGKTYTTTGTATSGTREPIVITGLAIGQHNIEVDNNLNNNANSNVTMGSFKIRSGYDMNITIRNNGTIQLKESRATATTAHPAQYRTPMATANFNTLMQNIRRQTRATTKVSLVTSAIKTNNNYFTTTQGRQLLLQVANQVTRQSLMESLYLRTTDGENFSDLYDLLSTQARRDQIAKIVNDYNYNFSVASVSSHNAYVTPMSASSFNTYYQNAQRQNSAITRMNYILNMFADPNTYFTSDQAKQLIQMVPEENNRLLLAKTAWRGITDASNFSVVSNLLYNSTNRTELNNYINAYSTLPTTTPTTTVHSPMTGTDFTALYERISKQWLPGAKIDVLRSSFANTSFYFTTAQAKQLILLTSSESNRLELAKSSYRTIVDPENFSQLYDVLSSQSSRDELARYVGTQTPGNTGGVYGHVAMNSDEYDELYRDVRSAFGLGAKMSQLTSIFANTSYYFNSAQIKQLIELVSSESNRLQLAKAAYKQAIDPEVFFSTVSVTISSQSGRNELEQYIRGL
jgi:hypothetical protein